MALFGLFRVVECTTPKLHIENPESASGRTFCGIQRRNISEKAFIPSWDCQRCYSLAEKYLKKRNDVKK